MGQKDILEIEFSKAPQLTPLESEILTQYQRLAIQLNTLSREIRHLSTTNNELIAEQGSDDKDTGGEAGELLDNLRNLEMKIGLVYTLFKGAVYSLFLDNEQDNAKEAEEFQNHEGYEDEEEQERDSESVT
ncbi:uncharacterized protein PRCAT00003016001 [Priceomyces carsonii]|uniref:uncharacterized protein n=1 Tax=Priceomyces carsonii TaxID=28549 RepID=UPI002ED84709|nr:unnamed protein product [Priceomyces carsonii]